jgi:pyruvate formate lyase activating enzyme
MSVDEVFDAVVADRIFYESSGGGVTVTGGEPLMEPRFVRALLEKLQADGIHTCVETSGCVDSSVFLDVLSVSDYVLFDLKLMDSTTHCRFTGRSNESVLANAAILAAGRAEFLFRMPLIPGVNDDPGNIRETADFLKGLGKKAERIELMPYHRLGESKYASIGRRYRLHDFPPLEPPQAEAARLEFERNGIACTVSM